VSVMISVPEDAAVKRWGVGALIMLALVMPAVSGVLIFRASGTTRHRQLLLDSLRRCGRSATAEIGARRSDDPIGVVNALSTVHANPGHHSYPTRSFSLRIVCSGETVRLRLARDSERPDEYWVFWQIDENAEEQALGIITSKAFDEVSR
jgi:hypothetical protein